MACTALPYPPPLFASYISPVPWIAGDDCGVAEDFIASVVDSSTNFASAAQTRAMNFINSVDDGRIIVSPDPIPIWPPL